MVGAGVRLPLRRLLEGRRTEKTTMKLDFDKNFFFKSIKISLNINNHLTNQAAFRHSSGPEGSSQQCSEAACCLPPIS